MNYFWILLFISASVWCQPKSLKWQKPTCWNKVSYLLKKVEKDSRCPEDVNCIWAGNVTVHLQVITKQKDTLQKQFVLPQEQENLKDWLFSFQKKPKNKSVVRIGLLPVPHSAQKINEKEYQLRFYFEKKSNPAQ